VSLNPHRQKQCYIQNFIIDYFICFARTARCFSAILHEPRAFTPSQLASELVPTASCMPSMVNNNHHQAVGLPRLLS
jgi:hypothetical protein